MQSKYQDLLHTIAVGERLVEAEHPSSGEIQTMSIELNENIDRLKGVVEERVELLDHSVHFQDSQQKVLAVCDDEYMYHSIVM